MNVRLKVCDPSGKVVISKVTYLNGVATIELPFIEAVKKDNPEFAKNGVVKYTVPQRRYQKAKEGLTKYLEDLFLKELAEDETIYPGNGGKSNPGRTKKESSSRSNEKVTGEDSNAVRDRGRGKKQSESDRGRVENSDVAQSSDPKNVGSGKSGD